VKETLAEIASLLAQGAPAGIANWWTIAERGINRVLTMLFAWPAAMVACALWSSSLAQKVVPILALVPVVSFLYFILKFVNPATIAMFAIPGARMLIQKLARQVGILVAAECGLGLFLWFVPISNDRWLVPVLLLAVLAFFGLKLADIGANVRAILALLIVGIAGVFMLGGRSKLGDLGKSVSSENTGRQDIGGFSDVVCLDDTGHRKELHYESFANTDFEESFPDGCGVLIAMPAKWGRQWQVQPAGRDRNVHPHIYVKDVGAKYHGPYDLWADVDMHINNASLFYIQAVEKGVKIHFWTDLVLPTSPPASPSISEASPTAQTAEPPTPRQSDRHIYHVGEDGVIAPSLLKKIEPAYTDQARLANFSGDVVVNIVVDENGHPTDLDIVDSPGFSLDETIIAAVEQWRFRPGTKDGVPVPVRAKIRVEFHRQ
jgi:TonB family protein